MSAKPLAVCLMSGGMDSAVCASVTRADGFALACLHANYGQRTQGKELAAFHALADHFGAVARLVVDFEHLKAIGGTSLIEGGAAVPTPGKLHGTAGTGAAIPSTYVPFRNGLLLSVAAAWAEVLGATRIVFGAVEQDSSGYPDCSEPFIAAMTEAIRCGTKPGSDLRITAPLVRLSKTQIVERGAALGTPFALTWSCYTGNDKACGVCESCLLRLRGFEQAGLVDPIPYA